MGVVRQAEDLLTRIKDLERQVRELRRRNISNAVISDGNLEVRTASGQVIMRAGDIPYNNTTVTGLQTFRANGTLASIQWDTPTGGGFWAFFDEAGAILLSNDTVSGSSLATPYLGYHVVPWSEVLSPPQSTTNAAMETLHRIHGQRQNPWIRVLLIVQSDAGTTGEVQVADAGTPLTAATPIAAATNTYTWIDAPVSGAHMDAKFLDVQARRTGGAGAIRIGVASVLGRQS